MKRTSSPSCLGGGRGTRLQPLTSYRAKPAVPLAGKYRLIDIPLSNCLNSGINQIYVLTQFQSVSLHRHIRGTYRFDNFSGGFVEILAAQQTLAEAGGSTIGTRARPTPCARISATCIEPGHRLRADPLRRPALPDGLPPRCSPRTSSSRPTSRSPPSRSAAPRRRALGIMRVDDDGRVVGFLREAADRRGAQRRARPTRPGSTPTASTAAAATAWPAWASTCSAARRWSTCWRRPTTTISAARSFPASIRARHVQLHLFDGYWEDIGTIRSFYEANLMLAQPNPPFELASATAPIYTRARFLPPTRVDGATIERSLVADGCVIGAGTRIENSVIGLRCRIGRDVIIRNSVIMGADFYETPGQLSADQHGRPAADRHRRGRDHRRRDRRQELPHRRPARGHARRRDKPATAWSAPTARSATASWSSPKTASCRKAGTCRAFPDSAQRRVAGVERQRAPSCGRSGGSAQPRPQPPATRGNQHGSARFVDAREPICHI